MRTWPAKPCLARPSNGTDLALAFVGQLVAEIQNRSSEVARIFSAVRSLVEIAGCGVTTMLTAETLKSAGPPGEQEAEIERILALGAQRVDIGQTGAESWTVLADPKGNEFCVVRPKRTLVD